LAVISLMFASPLNHAAGTDATQRGKGRPGRLALGIVAHYGVQYSAQYDRWARR
jgi:hypothetical protein